MLACLLACLLPRHLSSSLPLFLSSSSSEQLFARLQDLLQAGLERFSEEPAAREALLFGARWTLRACRGAAGRA